MSTNPYLDLLSTEESRVQRNDSATIAATGSGPAAGSFDEFFDQQRAAPGVVITQRPANPYAALAEQEQAARRAVVRVKQAAAVRLSTDATPEQTLKARRLAEQTGLPHDMVLRNLPELEQRATVARVDADTADTPVLRERFTDPVFASIAADDSKQLSLIERLTSSFKRGLTSSLQGGDAAGVKESADILNVIDRIERGDLATDADLAAATPYASMFAGVGRSPEALAAARSRAERSLAINAAEFVRRGDRLQAIPTSPDFERFQRSKGWGEALKAFADAPGSITSQIVAQSTGSMLPSLPFVAVGGIAGGARGLAMATGGTSFATEYVTALAEVFGQLGVNPHDQDAVLAAVRSPEFAALNRQAQIKAGIIGAVDAATAGVAGVKLASGVVKNLSAQAGVQAFGGAAGEAAGSVASGQEVSAAAVLSEAFGEVPGSIVDVALLSGRKVAQRRFAAQVAIADAEQVGEIIKAADESTLKARDPDTFAELVEHIQPEAVVYVSPEHLAGVDLSATPEVAAQMAEAQATGGDVQIRLADVVAHLPGEQLLPHLRMEPDALTLDEAQNFDGQTELVAEITGPAAAALLSSPEQASMSPADWDSYLEAADESAQAAIEERDSRALRDQQWLANAKSKAIAELKAEANAASAQIAEQVQAELREHPVHAARRWLKTGEMYDGTQTVGAKLNTSSLRDIYGDGPAAPWRYLPTNIVAAGDGLHVDIAGEMFGFDSGDAFVRALLETETEAQAVERMTEDRMREEHPDIADAIGRERSAEALIADRARTRFLATEAAALSKAIGSKAMLEREAQQYAEQSIARRKVRDVRPAQFKASAERAGREAAQAFRQGDTAQAAKAKRNQALQSALQTEATAVTAEVERALAAFKRMGRADDGSRDGNLADTARALLAQYGLSRTDRTAADYLAKVQNYDPELYADLIVLMDGLPPPVADHRELTVADFRAVHDRVEAIWTLARSTRQIEIDGQKVEIEQAAGALAKQLESEPAAKREKMVGTNDRLDLRMRLGGMRNALRRIEFWSDARDKGDKKGPFRTFIWQPVSEAVTKYRTQRNEYVGRFLELLKTIEPTLKPGKIAAPELADGVVFADRSALLHALLHVGNESNRRKLLLGYQWATEHEDGSLDTTRWDNFLRRMHDEGRITAKDWQFVQSTWDLLEALKPSAQAAHKQMFGHHFAEITAEPVQTPFGELAGGYVPAVTDTLLVADARAHGTMDDLLAGQNSTMFPAVTRGFTKGRIENYTKPLALDLRLLPAHIDKVSRFAMLGPVLRDTARLVTRNKTFRAAMDAVDPTAVESMLVPWLKRTATQTLNKAPESQADRAVARIANTVRNRTGLLLMAGNVVNTMQQLTGLSVAALRVKPKHLAGGLLEFVRSPTATAKAINELSPWMLQRSENGARDVDAAIHEMLTNPGALKRAEQFGTRYGHVLQQGAQNIIDRTVWLGAYRQAEAAGVSDAQAVREADSAVRMTQSSFAPEDAAKVEHAGAFTRMFLMFYSYFSGQLNMLATEAKNAQGDPARLALVYLLGFAIPAFTADLIVKGMRGEFGGDDEDGDELAAKLLESFFMSQARYALGMAPVVGQVGNAALGQFTPGRFDDRIGASPVYSNVEATVRAPRSIYRAIEGSGNPRTAVRDGLTAVGVLTGLPTGPLVRPLGYLADDRRDEVTVRGLVTGR